MQILILSIIAKCGVFTHVRELALSLYGFGYKPIVGLIDNEKTRQYFSVSEKDSAGMKKRMEGLNYFCFCNEEDLIKKTKNTEIKLVHIHSPILLSMASRIAINRKIPFIVTLHGIHNWSDFNNSLKSADRIIAIGPEVAKSAGKCYQSKIKIIYNGIDTEYFKPGNTCSPEKPLRIIWVGRTSGADARGAEYLAKAIHIARQLGLQIESKVLGNPLGANIKGMELCGWAYDPLEYLQWSHIAFGRGRALREAMACGNAGFLLAEGYGGLVKDDWFLGNNPPPLSGLLKHGYARLSATEIARDIIDISKSKEYLDKARHEARKIAVEHFDIKKMTREICKVYEEAVKAK